MHPRPRQRLRIHKPAFEPLLIRSLRLASVVGFTIVTALNEGRLRDRIEDLPVAGKLTAKPLNYTLSHSLRHEGIVFGTQVKNLHSAQG
jgi:hypothetical protein